jgi:hypothetical protein
MLETRGCKQMVDAATCLSLVLTYTQTNGSLILLQCWIGVDRYVWIHVGSLARVLEVYMIADDQQNVSRSASCHWGYWGVGARRLLHSLHIQGAELSVNNSSKYFVENANLLIVSFTMAIDLPIQTGSADANAIIVRI